ncbi:RNA-guided endonuclease IscB [Limnoraphis robusta]|uniref:RNA-guided endonuclease IscB n=1 Tax=Limnoraphis robusta TaxID=1118279 RepID=UPI002B1F65A6|nr:RNA-guided endonuclease IscB [Limnoraphis robusta]MEA5497824.1 RNA-guided endonuclease IscB [Limnoraphis robusta BA-68 BA1]
MSNLVFVLDTNRKPLTPCTPGMARSLLKAKKARVFRMYPFTIILPKEVQATPQPLTLKLDPGSKVTGIALLKGTALLWIAELTHRGQQIKEALLSRRQLRRSRRNRKTRYRQPRFLNRTRPEGWLAPSLQHRVDTTLTWVRRLSQLAPIGSIVQELVKFDLHLMQNAHISGVEYQQGQLQGYEVREYVLEKFNRQCVYCGAKDVPLEIEHVEPRSRGGSNRVSNLALACHPCNQAKGNQDVKDFLSGKADLLKRVLSQLKAPLKDATAVNATRWALFNALKARGLPVSTASGSQTKFNRTRLELPKTHYFDAACVGKTEELMVLSGQPLLIKATGHGTRQMCRTDKFGFPCRYVPRFKFVQGFQTGDIVKAVVTTGKKVGTYLGRVAIRSSGSFNLTTATGLVQGISYKYCKPLQKKDGYAYGY